MSEIKKMIKVLKRLESRKVITEGDLPDYNLIEPDYEEEEAAFKYDNDLAVEMMEEYSDKDLNDLLSLLGQRAESKVVSFLQKHIWEIIFEEFVSGLSLDDIYGMLGEQQKNEFHDLLLDEFLDEIHSHPEKYQPDDSI